MLVALMLAVSPAMASDDDGDGWDDEFEFDVEYVCVVDDVDWDGDGFGDEFGFEVEWECFIDDIDD
jgi:hypothetical protein